MARGEKTLRNCDRGHNYYKSSNCPTCPVCLQEQKPDSSFLALLSNPARQALEHEGIISLQQLSTFTEREILKLHGMGPRSMPTLKAALQAQGLSFKPGNNTRREKADVGESRTQEEQQG